MDGLEAHPRDGDGDGDGDPGSERHPREAAADEEEAVVPPAVEESAVEPVDEVDEDDEVEVEERGGPEAHPFLMVDDVFDGEGGETDDDDDDNFNFAAPAVDGGNDDIDAMESDMESVWNDGPVEGNVIRPFHPEIVCQSVEDAVRGLTSAAATAEGLGADARPGSVELRINLPEGGNARAEEEEDEHAPVWTHFVLFRGLVALLRQPGAGRILGILRLTGFDFHQATAYRPNDVEALFTDVILSHPALQTVSLKRCTIPAPYLEPLASSTSSSMRVRELRLVSCAIDREGLSHLAAWVGGDCPLRRLEVAPKAKGLEPEDCRLLCDSVCRNTHLSELKLVVTTIRADTLGHVVSSSPHSPLRTLHVTANLTKQGVASIARHLRTNTRMFELKVGDHRRGWDLTYCHRLMEEAVGTYNFTLRTLWVNNFVEYFILNPNHVIRTLLRRVEPTNYHVTPPRLWPLAFGTVSSFPTLLYRLLRRGNVGALCDVVIRGARGNDGPERHASASGGRKRVMADDDHGGGRSTRASVDSGAVHE